jgi:hypothetical protein
MSEIRLLERVRNAIRVRQYSLATEKDYSGWIVRFIMFDHKRHPAEMAKPEVEAFLSYLAVNRKVSPSTQNQGRDCQRLNPASGCGFFRPASGPG